MNRSLRKFHAWYFRLPNEDIVTRKRATVMLWMLLMLMFINITSLTFYAIFTPDALATAAPTQKASRPPAKTPKRLRRTVLTDAVMEDHSSRCANNKLVHRA